MNKKLLLFEVRRLILFQLIYRWLNRTFGDAEVLILLGLMGISLFIIEKFGSVFSPVFVSIVFAYLLQAPINRLKQMKIPGFVAMLSVFCVFLTLFAVMLLWLAPLLWEQLRTFYYELPSIVHRIQMLEEHIPPSIQVYVQASDWQRALQNFMQTFQSYSQYLIKYVLSNLPSLMMVAVYIVLAPLLIFFFLKDHKKIFAWFTEYLPEHRPMLQRVWKESNRQVGNYVRGKFLEALIVGSVTFVAFLIFKIKYAALLSFLVGVSVFIPYIGAAVVTVPVALVAFFQWGISIETIYLLTVYGIIQTLDGTLLVPILFSEAVNMHPIVIIIATLFFGAVWGLWGMFFAIPIAALIQAILQAWPKVSV
jgi:putative permease